MPSAALNLELEAQAALHLPAGAAVTTPNQRTAAGINAHRCAVDVVGGVVEAEFDPGKGGWDYESFTSYALPDFVR